jgi:hypothetical protein
MSQANSLINLDDIDKAAREVLAVGTFGVALALSVADKPELG